MTDEITMTTTEAAALLGIRIDSLYPLLRSNRLPAVRRDGVWHISRAGVEARARQLAERRRHRNVNLYPPSEQSACQL